VNPLVHRDFCHIQERTRYLGLILSSYLFPAFFKTSSPPQSRFSSRMPFEPLISTPF